MGLCLSLVRLVNLTPAPFLSGRRIIGAQACIGQGDRPLKSTGPRVLRSEMGEAGFLDLLMTKPSIPLVLVFSRSGPYAMMGREMGKSALMAVDEVNQSDEFDFSFIPHLGDPG